MSSPHRRYLACLIVAGAAGLAGPPAVAQDRQVSVLSLYGTGPDNPVTETGQLALRRTLEQGPGGDYDYYPEYLDLARFSDPGYEAAVLSFLRFKYAGRRLGLIVATGDAALDFVRRHRDHAIFADVPVVFSAAVRADGIPNATGIIARLNFRDTLDSAVSLRPETERVVVVSGASAFDKYYENLARGQFKAIEGRLAFTYLSGLPMRELLRRVAALPARSLVFFTTLTEDGDGLKRRNLETLDRLSAVSNAPMFTWSAHGMDRGIVGGRMLSIPLMAARTAELAARVLRGEKPDTIPVTEVDWSVTEFDWRQLQRWRISEARLPAGSIVRFRPTGVWELYSHYIVGGSLLLILQSGLVAGLLLQRTRRRRSEEALAESQKRYTLATAAGGVGVWEWNLQTNDIYVDPVLISMLGLADAKSPIRLEEWVDWVHPDDREAAMAQVQGCIRGAGVIELEHRMLHQVDGVRWLHTRGSATRRPDGTAERVIATSMDITERKRSEEQFRVALEAAPVGMLMADRAGRIVLVNAQIERLFGYAREELINRPVDTLLPERVRAEFRALFHLAPSARAMGADRDLHGLRKDGTEVSIEIALNPLRTPQGEFVLGSVADILERRAAEREREHLMQHLQQLSGRLIAAQDVERARIARDLHDDTSQQLAGLSIGLSALKHQVAALPGERDLPGELSSLQQRTMALAEHVRHLSHDLHPGVLTHVGLSAALSAHCTEIRDRHAVEVTFSAAGEFESLEPDTAICLFRVAQEALRNIVTHAGARHAEVRLFRTDEGVALTIVDDGRGFDPIQARRSSRGLGLVSMRERVRLAGGTINIVSEVNKSTRISVLVPAKRHAPPGTVSSRDATSAGKA